MEHIDFNTTISGSFKTSPGVFERIADAIRDGRFEEALEKQVFTEPKKTRKAFFRERAKNNHVFKSVIKALDSHHPIKATSDKFEIEGCDKHDVDYLIDTLQYIVNDTENLDTFIVDQVRCALMAWYVANPYFTIKAEGAKK